MRRGGRWRVPDCCCPSTPTYFTCLRCQPQPYWPPYGDRVGVRCAHRASATAASRTSGVSLPRAPAFAAVLAVGIARAPAAPHPPLARAPPLGSGSAHFHPPHRAVAELGVQLADKLGREEPQLGRPCRRIGDNGQLSVG